MILSVCVRKQQQARAKEKEKGNHQHRSHLRQRRNHAQRAHNDPRRHPNQPRRTPINEPILGRQQNALPRRLQHHDETNDRKKAEVPSQFLPLAHAVHIVAIVPGAPFLLLDFVIVMIIAGISSRVEGSAGFDDLDDLRVWLLVADPMGVGGGGGGGGEIHDGYFSRTSSRCQKGYGRKEEKEKKGKGKGHRGATMVCLCTHTYCCT